MSVIYYQNRGMRACLQGLPSCHKSQVTTPSLCVATTALFTVVIIHWMSDNQLQINSNLSNVPDLHSLVITR